MTEAYDIKRVEAAMCIAYNAHKGQTDKQGIPYIFHCFAVANKFTTSDEQIVGLLHDVFEDTDIKFYDVEWQFSLTTMAALRAITKEHSENYHDYIERVALNPLAARVKIEDLKHNLSRLDKLSEKEQLRLRPKYQSALAHLNGIES